MKKIVALLFSVTLLFGIGMFSTACGGSDDYYFKAVSLDLSEYTASGYSGSETGVQAIYGAHKSGTSSTLLNSLKGEKYFVGPFCGNKSVLTFSIESDAAVTGVDFKISLSSENGTVDMTWQAYSITVNGTRLEFAPFQLVGDLETGHYVPFKEVSFGKIDLKSGTNLIVIEPGENEWGPHGAAGGPGMDYIRITSPNAKLKLTKDYWSDNKAELGIGK